jgi:hypothetical protein
MAFAIVLKHLNRFTYPVARLHFCKHQVQDTVSTFRSGCAEQCSNLAKCVTVFRCLWVPFQWGFSPSSFYSTASYDPPLAQLLKVEQLASLLC